MSDGPENDASAPARQLSPRQVFLRGLAISLPAILTLVILFWILGGINDYIIQPTTSSVKFVIAKFLDRSVDPRSAELRPLPGGPPLPFCGDDYLVTEGLRKEYQRFSANQRESFRPQTVEGDENSESALLMMNALDEYFRREKQRREWIENRADEEPRLEIFADNSAGTNIYVSVGGEAVPYRDYLVVARDTAATDMPTSATRLYMEYAVRRYVGSAFTLSAIALTLVIIAVYFLGRVVSVRLGSWLVNEIETRLLGRLPVIRNVYGSAKQVTDFLFSENQVEYRRVVAIEYPRRGIWSLALVTGEGMLDVTTAVGEPCVSVLVPSSPMPVTGYTMCVPRSAVLDVDVTVDQAFQFCISCGVLVPAAQKVTPEILQRELTRRLAERMQDSPIDRRTLTLPPQIEGDEESEGSRPSE